MAREVNEQEYRLIDRVTAGFNTIAAGLGKLKTGMTELNQTAELASKGLGLVVGAARGLGDQVKSVADYETAMTRIIERTQATREEQDLLAQAVQNAQRELGVTAAVSADALLRMVKDGFSAREAADALGTSLAFAKAEGVDAAQAIDGLGGILDSFNEKPQIIGQLADQLTAASRAAGTSTEALTDGLSRVGLAADESNVSIDQTLAYLSLLAKRNIEGTAAARQLVSIMGDFRDPASAAGKALDDLGLSGLNFDQIITALASNSDQAAKVLQTLGDRPRAALQALLADGGGALRELNAIIDNSEGSAKRAADALKGTFNDSLDRVIASVDRAKIALGAPILQPLADGLQQLADKLNEAAASGAFDQIGKKLGEFVANAVPQIVDFLSKFDFEKAVTNISGFVDRATILFNELSNTVKIVSGTIGTVFDTVKAGAAVVVESFAGVANDVTELAVQLGVPAENLAQLFDDVATGARGLSDEALLSLQRRFGLTAEQANRLGKEIDQAAGKARQARADLRALADALPANDVGATAERWNKFGDAVAGVSGPAKQAKDDLGQLNQAVDEAAVHAERLKIAFYLAAQSVLFKEGKEGTAEFRALSAEIAKSEARIRELTAAQQKAKESTDQQTESTTRATAALRDYADASDDAGRGASNLADRNSQVRESFGNIGAAASSVAVDMGTLSEEYIRQSLAAAGASKSIRGYLDTLNRQFEAGIEQQKQVADRLAQQEKLNRGLDEEAQALDRLRQQYPAIAEGELKKLYDAQRRYTELLERQNRTKREGLDLDQQAAANAAGTAGGLNTGRNAGQQQGADQGGGGVAGGASIINNFNIAGVVTDEVARELANRIARFQRLSR
jgi:TP901 family phage tail tape measure protein